MLVVVRRLVRLELVHPAVPLLAERAEEGAARLFRRLRVGGGEGEPALEKGEGRHVSSSELVKQKKRWGGLTGGMVMMELSRGSIEDFEWGCSRWGRSRNTVD